MSALRGGVLVRADVWPAMCARARALWITIEDIRGSVVRIRVMVDMQRRAVSIMVDCGGEEVVADRDLAREVGRAHSVVNFAVKANLATSSLGARSSDSAATVSVLPSS